MKHNRVDRVSVFILSPPVRGRGLKHDHHGEPGYSERLQVTNAGGELNEQEDARKKLIGRGRVALQQWKDARPKMCRELEKNNELVPAVVKAQERAAKVYYQARKNGANHETADELANQEIFLPSEEEHPNLGDPLPRL